MKIDVLISDIHRKITLLLDFLKSWYGEDCVH